MSATHSLLEAVRDTVGEAGIFAVIFLIAHYLLGCSPAYTKETVRASYQAALLSCVQKASTRDAAKVCMQAVDKEYGVADGQ